MKNLEAFGLVVLMVLTACNNNSGTVVKKRLLKDDRSTSLEEGVTLLIADVDLIQVDCNSQYNTTVWNFTLKNLGHYDFWLSSLIYDTSHLRYKDKVTMTAGDAHIKKRPVGDKIVTNDPSVKEPWYKADSYMGWVFFGEPVEYQVQVISDGVIPHPSDLLGLSIDKHIFINSLILKPMVN